MITNPETLEAGMTPTEYAEAVRLNRLNLERQAAHAEAEAKNELKEHGYWTAYGEAMDERAAELREELAK